MRGVRKCCERERDSRMGRPTTVVWEDCPEGPGASSISESDSDSTGAVGRHRAHCADLAASCKGKIDASKKRNRHQQTSEFRDRSDQPRLRQETRRIEDRQLNQQSDMKIE